MGDIICSLILHLSLGPASDSLEFISASAFLARVLGLKWLSFVLCKVNLNCNQIKNGNIECSLCSGESKGIDIKA